MNIESIPNLYVDSAMQRLRPVVARTPLMYHKRLSEKYRCKLYLKREDMQPVRSYKIRGAFNKISSLFDAKKRGVVCASAGNHAQGVAYSCKYLQIKGNIFMPVNTPSQKIERVRAHGGSYIEVFLAGETYDESEAVALDFANNALAKWIPPFDDERIIEGQATVALEMLEDLANIDYVFTPVGGGGLAAGVSYYFNEHGNDTTIIGVEPEGAASMTAAFNAGEPVMLEKIDAFVDGAAVRKVGCLPFQICKQLLSYIHLVPEGKVCSTLLSLYNEDGILAEPAGILSVAALDDFADLIKDKNVVCILSGSNNDSNRMDEIKKLADEWAGLQHYLVIRFHHNPDGLKEFFTSILGPDDYVNRIEYIRRDHGRSTYALLGIRNKNKDDYTHLLGRLNKCAIEHREVHKEDFLFKYWV